MMAQAFTKMDLVTREEFDVQADLLARTRARVDQLAAQVQQLEERLSAPEQVQAGPALQGRDISSTAAFGRPSALGILACR